MGDSRFNEGRYSGGKLGFITVSMDQTVEEDMIRMRPEKVGTHYTRVFLDDQFTTEKIKDMRNCLKKAAGLLIPDGSLSIVSFACTAGSILIGEDTVINELSKGSNGKPATTAITAVVHALNTLKASNIIVIAPYIDEINKVVNDYLTLKGFDIKKYVGLEIKKDGLIAKIKPEYIYKLAVENFTGKENAIFISCTSMRSIEVINKIEHKLKIPVITTNQALLWHMLREIGNNGRNKEYGRLFYEH